MFAMPVYNEAATIEAFLSEILSTPTSEEILVVIVDDASTDGTREILERLAMREGRLRIYRNEVNSGHGESTVRALRRALDLKPRLIVATDGDGNVATEDLFLLAAQARSAQKITEGVRLARVAPLFRRFVSLGTQWLVYQKSGAWPKDANTPHRAYPLEELDGILAKLPASPLTPNLMISTLVRRNKLRIMELPVREVPRINSNPNGVSWGGGNRVLPSLRFLKFCGKAFHQWLMFLR